MSNLLAAPSMENIIDKMIELTCLAKIHRAVVAGSNNLDAYPALHCRRFGRFATTATYKIARGRRHAELRLATAA